MNTSVALSKNTGTRWSNPNWIKTDLARITEINGTLPLNHFVKRLPTYMGFNAWLELTVAPSTRDYIMSNEYAFNMSISAYLNLARFQASPEGQRQAVNILPSREPQKATERTTHV
jgi:hypothetical protein